MSSATSLLGGSFCLLMLFGCGSTPSSKAGSEPWAPDPSLSGATDTSSGAPYAPLSRGAAYNAQIDSQIYTIAKVVKGPDLWATLKNQTSLFLDSTNVHPNDAGIAAYRKAWATTMLATVYPH